MTIAPTDQMLANFRRVAKARGMPPLGEPFLVRPDRVFVVAPHEAIARLNELASLGNLVKSWGDHRIPVDIGEDYSPGGNYRGWFPHTLAGDQWVVYVTDSDKVILEMDMDRGSPVDVAGFFRHLKELIDHWMWPQHLTNPYAVARALDKAGLEA